MAQDTQTGTESTNGASVLTDGLGAYSKTLLNDNNFDEELEKLCDIVGRSPRSYENTLHFLPDGFYEYPFRGKDNKNLGFSVWINSKVMPNKGSDFAQAFDVGLEAFQFGDCFILLKFEDVI
jgi:hypothetical protein